MVKLALRRKKPKICLMLLTETIGDTLGKGEKDAAAALVPVKAMCRKARKGVGPRTRVAIQVLTERLRWGRQDSGNKEYQKLGKT